MPIYFRKLSRKIIAVAFAALLSAASCWVADSRAAEPTYRGWRKVIVIDPGHGGLDSGVRGPSGSLEKSIVLDFSQRVSDKLKSRYEVRLTRTSDYAVTPYQRADLANQVRADMFISFHAGGSYRLQSTGIEIFHHQVESSPNSSKNPSTPPANPSSSAAVWDTLQGKHLQNSKRLTQILKDQIEADIADQQCRINTAPLLVLRGLDMPAVLVEIGYLSNPSEEKELSDPEVLDALADAICRAVDEFFDKN